MFLSAIIRRSYLRLGSCLTVILAFFWIPGCEDVISIDPPTEEPRLIVDALIRVDTTQTAIPVVVTVRETSGFFETVPPTGLKQITMSNEAGAYTVLLETEEGSGVYQNVVSFPFMSEGGELLLQVEHKDQRYLARTRYVPAVPIDSLRQGDDTLFGDEDTEIIVTYTDRPGSDDFYLFDFDLDEFLVTEDEFYQGRQFTFSYFIDRDLEPGTDLDVSILGVDRSFYNYMSLLIEQSQVPAGPFQTPAATVRGNIINVTEIDNIDFFDNVDQPNNFALGYFAVCQEFKRSLVIE